MSNYANEAAASIPFSNLIGGPLVAAVDAQSLAARAAVEFIQEVAFNVTEDGTKEAINVVFVYQKGTQKTNLIVPVLTIIPVPYLRIDEVNIDFKATISTEQERDTSLDVSVASKSTVNGKYGKFFSPAKMKFSANVTRQTDVNVDSSTSNSTEYNLGVQVRATQDQMPGGMKAVLEMLNNSIASAPAGGTMSLSFDQENLTSTSTFKLFIQLINGENQPHANEYITLSTTNFIPDFGDITGLTLVSPTSALKTDDQGILEVDLSFSGTATDLPGTLTLNLVDFETGSGKKSDTISIQILS